MPCGLKRCCKILFLVDLYHKIQLLYNKCKNAAGQGQIWSYSKTYDDYNVMMQHAAIERQFEDISLYMQVIQELQATIDFEGDEPLDINHLLSPQLSSHGCDDPKDYAKGCKEEFIIIEQLKSIDPDENQDHGGPKTFNVYQITQNGECLMAYLLGVYHVTKTGHSYYIFMMVV